MNCHLTKCKIRSILYIA